MQLFSYNPHPFLFIAFSCSKICFIAFPSMFLLYSTSQHVLWFFQHVYLHFTMIYRFDIVGLAFFGQDISKFQACAQIYMFMLRSTCLCLDLCLFGPCVVPMFRSICLCALCHVCCNIPHQFKKKKKGERIRLFLVPTCSPPNPTPYYTFSPTSLLSFGRLSLFFLSFSFFALYLHTHTHSLPHSPAGLHSKPHHLTIIFPARSSEKYLGTPKHLHHFFLR